MSILARSLAHNMSTKWILITGGSRGIGKSLVIELHKNWNIVFTVPK